MSTPGVKKAAVGVAEWQLHRTGDMSAIYKDGVLFDSGDPDNMRNKVLTELGVIRVSNDAFMLGQDKKNGIAITLAAITTWQAAQTAKTVRLAEIRASIAALKAEAHALGTEA
jgi:hypothetical protein